MHRIGCLATCPDSILLYAISRNTSLFYSYSCLFTPLQILLSMDISQFYIPNNRLLCWTP